MEYIINYDDGTQYIGNIKDNKRNGVGLLKKDDILIYEGEWLNDKMHGKGKLFVPDEYSYVGEFVEGMKHGKGVKLTVDHSSEYNGMWEYNYQSGEGYEKYKGGSYYKVRIVLLTHYHKG